jgi:hypothetical protein
MVATCTATGTGKCYTTVSYLVERGDRAKPCDLAGVASIQDKDNFKF